MKYKSSQIFWGFLFLTIGVLFLLDKNNIAIQLPDNAVDYWPILIILWGISILSKGTSIKPLVSSVAGIIVGLFIFISIFGTEQKNDTGNITEHNYTTSEFNEDFRNETKTATLSLHSGIGKIKIGGLTDKLIEGKSSGFYNAYKFKTRYRDDDARIILRHSNEDFEILNNNKYRKLDISLNPQPEWKIDIKVGAAQVNLDFSKYKVSKFNLKTGATKTKLILGDKQETIKIHIEMGAATLKIYIPEKSGCIIKGDMVMVAKDFEGFEKIDKRRYKSSNFDNAEKKIYINFDGGVSTLKIERY